MAQARMVSLLISSTNINDGIANRVLRLLERGCVSGPAGGFRPVLRFGRATISHPAVLVSPLEGMTKNRSVLVDTGHPGFVRYRLSAHCRGPTGLLGPLGLANARDGTACSHEESDPIKETECEIPHRTPPLYLVHAWSTQWRENTDIVEFKQVFVRDRSF